MQVRAFERYIPLMQVKSIAGCSKTWSLSRIRNPYLT